MNALELVGLSELMALTPGRPDVVIGLIDGPVAVDHPDLTPDCVRGVAGKVGGVCSLASSAACAHGTFVAGMLCARRGSAAPAICPGCTLVVRPVFTEIMPADAPMPSATPGELAGAIVDCVEAGARILNLSLGLLQPSLRGERELGEALEHVGRRGVVLVAAAGNQGVIGSSVITRHPWVLPVVACDRHGRPIGESNLGASIAKRGLSAPGEDITSLHPGGGMMTVAGTSVAAPFVTGAIALLWSAFPRATAAELRLAIARSPGTRRPALVPPLLNAWASYHTVLKAHSQSVRAHS